MEGVYSSPGCLSFSKGLSSLYHLFYSILLFPVMQFLVCLWPLIWFVILGESKGKVKETGCEWAKSKPRKSRKVSLMPKQMYVSDLTSRGSLNTTEATFRGLDTW